MSALVERLRAEGISSPIQAMSEAQAVDLELHLKGYEVRNSHVWAKATEPGILGLEALRVHRWPVFAPTMEALITAPHWWEVALSYLPYAQEYFNGAQPRLYSLNAFWSCPVVGPVYPYTQSWHRDGDDAQQFTLFMFGSAVRKLEDGGFLYQRGTHKVDDNQIGRDYRLEPPDGITETFTGPAGSMVVVDTGGLHSGVRPVAHPRLLCWARYSTANPPRSYAWDALTPVPKEKLGSRYPQDPAIQEAIKLVVA